MTTRCLMRRQLVREGADPPRSMPTISSSSPPSPAARPGPSAPVRPEDVLHLAADAGHRVERVHRALEDHRHLSPAERARRSPTLREIDRLTVPVVVLDHAGGHPGRGSQHPGQRVGEVDLPQRFPHDAQHLPGAAPATRRAPPGRPRARVLHAHVAGPQHQVRAEPGGLDCFALPTIAVTAPPSFRAAQSARADLPGAARGTPAAGG